MIETIKTKIDLCTGCNRCVRECPMETANITYQDEAGNIKVKIDNEKCISCGRCVSACKHEARYYADDTGQFFNDLKNGVPISLIAAPSIRTNIPEYKRLFTFLKQSGVKKIYDVSLGADISIWAHIRYIEKNDTGPIITQPCPVVVSYCEIYRQDLLKYLSPVHGPMACASIYIKKYQGIHDRMAALSPCIAKTNEFEDTHLVQYNVTFIKLLEYLKENNIELPKEETEFDHNESGLGCLFPMPGGLKENIEYFIGKKLHVAKAEGISVFKKLDVFAETPVDFLPEIFDVLNCIEGCNEGSAASHDKNIFEIDKIMDTSRRKVTEGRRKIYYESLYKTYDNTFDLSHFLREYKPVSISFPSITEADINKAFELLGKTDNKKQSVDCGACGSNTCHDMARKIALGVNIPINCIVKSMEDAKLEHENNILANEQLTEMGKTREADERIRVMLDTSPLCAHIWDENIKIIDCNQAAVNMFNLSSKQEYIEKYFELTPEFQSGGVRSIDKLKLYIKKTYEEGYQRLEWMRQSLDGEPIPVELTLIPVDFQGRKLVAGYNRDLREYKKMMKELEAAQLTTSIVFESNPQINILFDSGFNAINCNPAAVNFWGFKSKQEFLEGIIKRVRESIPMRQPNGRLSASLVECLDRATKNDHIKLDTELVINGTYRCLDIEFIKIPYENSFAVVCYINDMTDIRERERELIRIREENDLQLAKLKLMVKATKIGLWDMEVAKNDPINLANRLVWSDEIRHMLGFTDENDFPNTMQSLNDRIHPDEREKPLVELRKHLLDKSGRTPYSTGFRIKKKNGEYGYFHTTGETIRDEEGSPIRTAGAMTDISETKKLLLDNELQLAKINMAVKTTKLALWEMEVDTDPVNPVNRVTWSDELRNQLGYQDINDFPNAVSSLQFILHPDDKQKTVDALVNHLSDRTGNTPYDEEYRAMRKNGEYGFYRGTGETVRDADGNPIRVVGTQMDITETKNTLLNSELQLAKLNMAVKATKIGLWDMEIIKDDPVNPKNAFTWSDEFRNMLGYTNENDFPNLFSSWSDRIHPDDKEKIITAFEKHMMDTTGKTPYDIEYRMFRKNGECGYFRDCGETIRDEYGSPIRAVGTLLDVTDTKNLLNETEKQRIVAETANKAKSSFLSTMSHEIRTPMNAILGITEILLQNETLVPEVKEAIEKINNSGDLLLGIINDILDFSKIEAGKMEIIIDQYEITSLISDTAQLNIMHIGSKPIEFELYVDENTPALLLGDELRIKQVMNNLLSNAFKYTQAGKVTMSVSAEAIDNEKVTLVVSISDTGQGMTKEQLAELFNEFARFNLETNRSTEGTGLGMSITRKLIQIMNGELYTESEPGKGSVFTVRLPQGRIGSALLGREMAENLRLFRTNSRSQMKRVQLSRDPMPYGSVLIVDDVETNIFVSKGLLSPYKLKIDSADSGYAAIEKIKRGNIYDIIFMDHMMPKMDGIEATKIIRDLGYDHTIVALTANAVAGQADIFLKNGFDDYISKPIDIRQLNSVLNRLIRDKQPPEIVEAARKQAMADKEPFNGSAPRNAIDPHIAEAFVRDALKAIAVLEILSSKNDYSNEENMRTYIINMHGIKGALANIGKTDLSTIAAKLEKAGREGNFNIITSITSAFLSSLRTFTEELTPHEETAAGGEEDKPHLAKMLLAIKAACGEYDELIADKALSELRKMTWSRQTTVLLSTIAERLLHSDFDEIVNDIDKFTAEL